VWYLPPAASCHSRERHCAGQRVERTPHSGSLALAAAHLAYRSALPQYVKYSYIGVSVNEYTGLVLTCAPDQLVSVGGGPEECPVTSGEQVLEGLYLDNW
jgi:hypothetical protein